MHIQDNLGNGGDLIICDFDLWFDFGDCHGHYALHDLKYLLMQKPIMYHVPSPTGKNQELQEYNGL
jgi:hypothetical protein